MESDYLETPEEDIFGAVMAWVKEDEMGRKGELERLLRLVRFLMMNELGMVIAGEPLVVAQQPLAFNLLMESTSAFAESAEAVTCPRLRPRQRRRLPAQVSRGLAFTRVSAEYYDVSGEGGALLQAKRGCIKHAAGCAGHAKRDACRASTAEYRYAEAIVGAVRHQWSVVYS